MRCDHFQQKRDNLSYVNQSLHRHSVSWNKLIRFIITHCQEINGKTLLKGHSLLSLTQSQRKHCTYFKDALSSFTSSDSFFIPSFPLSSLPLSLSFLSSTWWWWWWWEWSSRFGWSCEPSLCSELASLLLLLLLPLPLPEEDPSDELADPPRCVLLLLIWACFSTSVFNWAYHGKQNKQKHSLANGLQNAVNVQTQRIVIIYILNIEFYHS